MSITRLDNATWTPCHGNDEFESAIELYRYSDCLLCGICSGAKARGAFAFLINFCRTKKIRSRVNVLCENLAIGYDVIACERIIPKAFVLSRRVRFKYRICRLT